MFLHRSRSSARPARRVSQSASPETLRQRRVPRTRRLQWRRGRNRPRLVACARCSRSQQNLISGSVARWVRLTPGSDLASTSQPRQHPLSLHFGANTTHGVPNERRMSPRQVRCSVSKTQSWLQCTTARNCQKQAGTAFAVVVGIPKSALSIQGHPKTFHIGQRVDRNFCPECGSAITSDLAVVPDLTFIKAGTLDDTTLLDPKMHVLAAPWRRLGPLVMRIERRPLVTPIT